MNLFIKLIFVTFSLALSTQELLASCPANQEERCSYETQNVCAYRTEWTCTTKIVCDDDGSNCRSENQCGYESVFSCQPEQVMVCECIVKPGEVTNPNRCREETCSECELLGRQYCGIYDFCERKWEKGRWEVCQLEPR